MTLAERIERLLDNAPCKRCGLGREAATHMRRGPRAEIACRYVLDRYVTAREIAHALAKEGIAR